MSASQIIFYAISALILGAGLLAVTSTKIFRSAIWLLFSLIVVYVGGIVVLIIFSIFLTQESGKKLPKPGMQKIIFSALAVLFGFGASYNLIYGYDFKPSTQPFSVSASEMGTQMLSPNEHGYLLPFEVVSILLLAAMVGCIVIAMKPVDKKPEESGEMKWKNTAFPPPPEKTVTVISKSNLEKEITS